MLRRFSRSSSDWPFARARSAQPPTPARACRRPSGSACRGSFGGSNRNASGRRTRTGTCRSGKPQLGGDVAQPRSRRAASTPPRRSARAARRPPDRSSRSLRDCRAACRRCRRRRRSCSSISSTGSASDASTSGSSPKILTSIGVGLPSRSPSMSCSSWTNSISASGAASCSFGRRSEMISSADRLALAARLQAHQDVAGVLRRGEQPELRSGAPRVRRHFGRLGDDLFDARAPGDRFPRARCPPASGSRRRIRLRRPAAEIRCRPSRTAPTVATASTTADDARREADAATHRVEVPSVDALEPAVLSLGAPPASACDAGTPSARAAARRSSTGTATAAPPPTGSSTARERTARPRPTAGRAARTRRPSSASSWSAAPSAADTASTTLSAPSDARR